MLSRSVTGTAATLYLLVLLMVGCNGNSETDHAAPVVISRGPITLTVEPAIGARISSLTFNGVELLKTSRDSLNLQWGSTAWSSPQEDWQWPPIAAFDTEPYTVTELRENVLLLEGPLDPGTLLRMRKRISLGPNNDVGLTYWLTNEGVSSIKVALWENTRLPYAGRFEFAADSIRGTTGQLPAELKDSIYTVYADDRHPKRLKIFADLPKKVASYYHNGLVLRKHHVANAFYRVAPGQAPLEIYLDRPAGFVEFELQGDYRLLEPGESNNLRVRWEIGRADQAF